MDNSYFKYFRNSQDNEFYFSEKFCDPLLFLTMPIYKGCKKIDKFFPKGSYIEFDDSKGIDYAIDMIFDYSKSKYREENIELLKEIQPTLIYSFNNEIHLVFNDSNYLYNGNITKKLSKCVSLSTIALSKAFNRSIVCTGYAVEFYKNHEILNYLIWRQYDCKRNTLNLLYKCKNPDKEIPKLSVIENDIEINKKIIYGILVKQKLVSINDKNQKEYLRNTIVIEEDGELLFDKDFDNNLENLINSKYIL